MTTKIAELLKAKGYQESELSSELQASIARLTKTHGHLEAIVKNIETADEAEKADLEASKKEVEEFSAELEGTITEEIEELPTKAPAPAPTNPPKPKDDQDDDGGLGGALIAVGFAILAIFGLSKLANRA